MQNPYEVLGCFETDDDAAIKKAYRKLSKMYHPDNNVNNPNKKQAEEKFKDVQAAYEQIMSDRALGVTYSSNSARGQYGPGSSRYTNSSTSSYGSSNNGAYSQNRSYGNSGYANNSNGSSYNRYNNSSNGTSGSGAYGNSYGNSGNRSNGSGYANNGGYNNANSNTYNNYNNANNNTYNRYNNANNNANNSYNNGYNNTNNRNYNNGYNNAGNNGYSNGNGGYNNGYNNTNNRGYNNGGFSNSGNSYNGYANNSGYNTNNGGYNNGNNANGYNNRNTNGYSSGYTYNSNNQGNGTRYTGNSAGWTNTGYRNYWNGVYTNGRPEENDEALNKIADLINKGMFNEALFELTGIKNRSAVWYYYSAVANLALGQNIVAKQHAQMAYDMDPGKREYFDLYSGIQQGAIKYRDQNAVYKPGNTNNNICQNSSKSEKIIGGTVFCCCVLPVAFPFCC